MSQTSDQNGYHCCADICALLGTHSDHISSKESEHVSHRSTDRYCNADRITSTRLYEQLCKLSLLVLIVISTTTNDLFSLIYVHTQVNPILYAFLSENFRKAFHKIIACNLRGIYGANQSSYMQQTGQTSVVHSNYLAPVQTNSQLKRIDIPNKPPRPNDLNNNVNNDANDTPDMAESNRCLKSVNFSIIADGGLFPGNKQQDYLNRHSPSPTTDDQRSGDTTATLNKPINAKPILSSKGRFKCLDDEIVDEFVHTMELHSTNDESENDFIPMYELNKKTVPSVLNDSSAHEPTTTNETMNRTNGNINNSTTTTTASTAGLTTVTTMSNVGSNGVFL